MAATLPAEYDYLTADERAMIDLLADVEAAVPRSFHEFVDAVKPGYVWYEYNSTLADELQLVADGYYKRVMAYMPPRLGKSESISKLFSAYYLYRHPERWVALASYGAELAYDMSRASRTNYIEGQGTGHTGGETEAVKHWETGKGGGEWAVGVRGPATGKGASLFIIDDPVKDEEEASSEVIQVRNLSWYDTVVMTRLAKDAAVVIVQTRFNQKDLSGALLERENGDSPECWRIVCFPAEYDHGAATLTFPETCSVAPDWRTIREPDENGMRWTVCPDRLDPKFLAQRKRTNPYVWNALYQQNPTPHEGGMFKRHWFAIVPNPPLAQDIIAIVRRWDLGATKNAGDWTVGVKMAKTRGGAYYVLDVQRFQEAEGPRDQRIKQTAITDRELAKIQGTVPVTVRLPQDPGQAGKSQAAHYRRLLDGFIVQTEIETGDKGTRAKPLASASYAPDGEYGRVRLVAAGWNEPFLAEYAAFPYGNNDDQVDAGADAYNALASAVPPRTDTDPSNYPVVRR